MDSGRQLLRPMKQGVSSANMNYEYRTPKQALDALLERYSAFEVSELLDIHRANISHYIHRYNRERVPEVIGKAIISKGLVKKKQPRKRIRSQINWESKEQKKQFQTYLEEQGFFSVTEYCRERADETRDNRLIHGVWYDIWQRDD